MVTRYKISELQEFDAAAYLTGREAVVAYLEAMLGDEDCNAELAKAIDTP